MIGVWYGVSIMAASKQNRKAIDFQFQFQSQRAVSSAIILDQVDRWEVGGCGKMSRRLGLRPALSYLRARSRDSNR
jgi:hypothetical protein